MTIQDDISRAFQLYEEKSFHDSKAIFESALRSELTISDEIHLRFGYGYPLSALGLVDDAVDNYKDLGRLGKENGKLEIELQALHQIGMVYREANQYQEAIAYFNEEQKMIHQYFRKNYLFSAANLYELGYTHLLNGNEDLAFKYLRGCLTESYKSGDPIMQACAKRAMGEFYAKQNNLETARDYFKESIQTFNKADDEIGAAEVVELMDNLLENTEE